RSRDLRGLGEGLARVGLVLVLSYVALARHVLEHQVAAGERVVRIRLRVVCGWVGDDAREHCRLPGQKLRRAAVAGTAATRMVPAEIGLGGGLDAVGAAA